MENKPLNWIDPIQDLPEHNKPVLVLIEESEIPFAQNTTERMDGFMKQRSKELNEPRFYSVSKWAYFNLLE